MGEWDTKRDARQLHVWPDRLHVALAALKDDKGPWSVFVHYEWKTEADFEKFLLEYQCRW